MKTLLSILFGAIVGYDGKIKFGVKRNMDGSIKQ